MGAEEDKESYFKWISEKGNYLKKIAEGNPFKWIADKGNPIKLFTDLFVEEEFIKPPFLKNKSIAIVSPSLSEGGFIYNRIKVGIKNLQEMGFKVLEGQYIFREYSPYEEDYKKRAGLIESFSLDSEIGCLLCKTGGFGSENILEFLDLESIKKNPKIICGFSDNTMVLLYLNTQLKMVVFYGPTLVSGIADLADTTKKYFVKVLKEGKYPLEIKLDSFRPWKTGKAKGKVIGGNLTILLNYLNAFPEVSFKHKILFIEDVNETYANLNRMIYQLKRKEVFEDIDGMIIGEFLGIDEDELNHVKQHILHHTKDKNIPILYGFKSGHEKEKIILPFGTEVTVDSTSRKVIYEECPFKED